MILRKLMICRCRCLSTLKISRHYSSRNILKLKDRGLLAEVFPEQYNQEILDLISTGKQTVYAGFDPTATSLHIGNLAIIIKLLHWQRSGQQPIVLLGGATAQIGDPSGRKSERTILRETDVNNNAEEIGQMISRIFENHEKYFAGGLALKPVKVVNNLQWWGTMSALDFAGKVGRNFRLSTMLGKQSVKSRMETTEGMSFTEFVYQILQAYDWLRLFKDYNCRFQIGGNDQLGNIVAGFDLIAKVERKRVFGLTVPLVLNKYGDKFGKSSNLPPVWLSEKLLSPFDFYQYFIRAEDLEVEHLLKLYTFEPIEKIEALMRAHKKNPEQRLPQNALAHNVTLLIHGEKGLEHAKKLSSIFYEQNMEEFKNFNVEEHEHLFHKGMYAKLLLQPGITVSEAAVKAGCFLSESDAVRMINSGGFSINMKKVQNPQEVISTSSHILPNNLTLMRVGKKRYTIVKWAT